MTKRILHTKFCNAGNNMFAAYSFDGETVFRVMPIGQESPATSFGIEAHGISITNDKAEPVFTLKTGDKIRLRGAIDFRKLNGYDVGVASRVFRAQSIEVTRKWCQKYDPRLFVISKRRIERLRFAQPLYS